MIRPSAIDWLPQTGMGVDLIASFARILFDHKYLRTWEQRQFAGENFLRCDLLANFLCAVKKYLMV